jgi:nucleoid DNA-binding protein
MARHNKDSIVAELQLHEAFVDAPKYKVKEFVEDFFQSIADKVAAGDTISVAGFGKFEPFTRGNGTVTPKFRPAKAFKDATGA